MVSDLKTKEEWTETVDNMASIGAKGMQDEFGQVLLYLARNFTKVNVNTTTARRIAPVGHQRGSSAGCRESTRPAWALQQSGRTPECSGPGRGEG